MAGEKETTDLKVDFVCCCGKNLMVVKDVVRLEEWRAVKNIGSDKVGSETISIRTFCDKDCLRDHLIETMGAE